MPTPDAIPPTRDRGTEVPPARRVLAAVVVACCLPFIAAMLIAGHGPWAGRRLISVTADHGLTT